VVLRYIHGGLDHVYRLQREGRESRQRTCGNVTRSANSRIRFFELNDLVIFTQLVDTIPIHKQDTPRIVALT